MQIFMNSSRKMQNISLQCNECGKELNRSNKLRTHLKNINWKTYANFMNKLFELLFPLLIITYEKGSLKFHSKVYLLSKLEGGWADPICLSDYLFIFGKYYILEGMGAYAPLLLAPAEGLGGPSGLLPSAGIFF